MKRDKSLTFLGLLKTKIEQPQSRAQWATATCPLGPWRHEDGESSPGVFGIRCETGDSFCNCFSCGWHGSQSDLILEMRRLNKLHPMGDYPFGTLLQLISNEEELLDLSGLDSPDIEEMLFGEKKTKHVFPEWWLDTFAPWDQNTKAIAYLKERGIAQEVAEFLDVRWDTSEKRLCFPIRNFKGELMGLHGRTSLPDVEPRYKMYLNQGRNNPIIWMGEGWVDLDLPVIEVEGPIDLASVLRVYRNVVSPLFSNPSMDKMKRMGGASEWITFLDRGTGGDLGRQKAEKAFSEIPIRHIIPPQGCKDPGAMSVEQLVETLSDIVPLSEING